MLLIVGTAFLAWRLTTTPPTESKKSAAPTAPAKVSKVAREDDFATVTLTEQAEKRLDLQTAVAQERAVPRIRLLGGEVVTPPGKSVIVSAPLAGILHAPARGTMPVCGAPVKKNEEVLQLLPIVTPEAEATLRATAEEVKGQFNSATEQEKATKIARDRALKLYKTQAGSKRNWEEAEALYKIACEAVKAAGKRLDALTKATAHLGKGTGPPIPVPAPCDGVLRTVSALPGQTVPSGAALFEIIDPRQVWVRLSVYVGDLSELAADAKVKIGNLTDAPGQASRWASPIQAPPSANPLAATADLFYELDNSDGRFRPGERVGVHIPLKAVKKSLVVPWSAIVHDYHGGTWVYVKVRPHTYARHRVRVLYVHEGAKKAGSTSKPASQGEAVVEAGGLVGKEVVSVGAIELFGTEVGFAK
jgi:hypothetical protein